MFNIKINAIAVGSYARKIIKDYLKIDNLLENEEKFKEAVAVAKKLVDVCLENMKNG